MYTVCTIVIIGIVLYLGFKIWEADNNSRKAYEEEIEHINYAFFSQQNNFDETLHSFFNGECGNDGRSYQATENLLSSTLAEMRKINLELKSKSKNENDDYTETIEMYAKTAERFSGLGNKFKNLPFSMMMDIGNYGKVQKNFWDSIRSASKESIYNSMRLFQSNLFFHNYDAIFSIRIESILGAIWFYAIEKPYSADSFKTAVAGFKHLAEYDHIDVTIAELYAMKQMGGEDVLRERISNLLCNNLEANQLMVIASALMWMNAYQTENVVLQHMLNTGMQMTAKMQERLHSLTIGGGKAPSGFDVASTEEDMYFDVSALTWKDDEYIGLFENLTFQEKTLTYSLAVRDEDKELFLVQGISVPSADAILHKLDSIFSDEYGDAVTTSAKKCTALSGSGEERLNGILVTPKECSQMSILIHIAHIGKKVNIKFYTLFMPKPVTVSEQKQQVLSLYKKLSPSVNMWESSLKDTILLSIQQLLNSNLNDTQGSSVNTGASDAPVF